MSEFFPRTPEQQALPDNSHELIAEHIEKRRAEALEQIAKTEESMERLTQKVEQHAKSKEEMQFDRDNPERFVQEDWSSADRIRYNSLQSTLRQAQADLSKSEKSFSRLVHNQKVEVVSDLTSKTLARPSGLLIGGLTSFVGSLLLLFLGKKYGYEYNYLVSIALFGGGWLLGILGEVLWQSLRKITKTLRK